MPTEKGTIFHLAYVRQALHTGLARSLNWVDTRDMVMDGMTKGSVDREELQKFMSGTWQLKHAMQSFGHREKDSKMCVS